MADFDPDAYLADKGQEKLDTLSGGFDPDSYLKDKGVKLPSLMDRAKEGMATAADTVQRVGRSIPVLGPLAVKGANALSAGIDAAVGGVGQGGSYLDRAADAYDKFSAQDLAHEAQFSKAHPNVALAENLAGSALLPIPGAALTGAAGAAARIGGAAAMQGADAYLRGSGEGEAAKAAGITGGIQAGLEAIPYVGKALAPAASKLAESPVGQYLAEKYGNVQEGLENFANRKAFKALEPNLRLEENNISQTVAGRPKSEAIGQRLRDEGVVGFGDSVKNINAKAENLRQTYGKQVGASLEAADTYAAKLPAPVAQTFKIAPADLAATIETDLIKPMAGEFASQDKIKALENIAASLRGETVGGKADNLTQWSLAEANQQKSAIGNKLKVEFGREQSPQKEALKDVYALLNDEIESKVQNLDKVHQVTEGVPGSFRQDFMEAKKGYGPMAEATKITDKAIARNERNRSSSLTSYITGGATGAALTPMFGPVIGAAGGLMATGANMLAKHRGNATMSAMAGGASNLMERLSTAPETLGKYAAPLANAAKRGQTSLAAAHYVMSQNDPEYQKLFNGDSGER